MGEKVDRTEVLDVCSDDTRNVAPRRARIVCHTPRMTLCQSVSVVEEKNKCWKRRTTRPPQSHTCAKPQIQRLKWNGLPVSFKAALIQPRRSMTHTSYRKMKLTPSDGNESPSLSCCHSNQAMTTWGTMIDTYYQSPPGGFCERVRPLTKTLGI